jgi:hypothetical protein
MQTPREAMMADAFIDVQIVEDIALPYESGAEQWLDETMSLAWQDVAGFFAGIRLDPLFSVDVAALADLVDTARILGEEPPNPFAWFEIPCDDEAFAEALLPLIEALPFVIWAGIRNPTLPAGLVSFGTNPECARAQQIGPAPYGVDAIYAWGVAGGTAPRIRVCDVEHGWDLNHQDLIGANIRAESVFGSIGRDHGTGVLGILMAADNGVGLVGIAPEAAGFLVTEARPPRGVLSLPAALAAAGIAAQRRGVVLMETSHIFVPGAEPAIPSEFHRPTQTAIRLLTAAQINVIEPAGNRGVDLDQFPFLAHLRPDSPTFSGAVMVGGADLTVINDTEVGWSRSSTYGTRVDCFAAFSNVRSPSSAAVDAYQQFTGTSAASAIVAGIVCAIQGMSEAASGEWLLPQDIRRLLRDPDLGTSTGAGLPGGIGSMPDLRKIARHMKWPRILPVAAMLFADDGAMIVQIDDNDLLSRRSWTLLSGFLPHMPLPPPDDSYHFCPHTPAVMVTLELEPLMRTLFEVVAVGNDGTLHYFWWDTLGYTGELAPARSIAEAVAAGHDVSAVHPTPQILAVAGISPEGRLVFMLMDAAIPNPLEFTEPLVLDGVASYRRSSGPVVISRLPGQLDVVAIDDGGNLRWAAGSAVATWGSFFGPFVSPSLNVPLDPRARPGVVGTFDGLVVVAVGVDGLLYSCGFGLMPMMVEGLTPIDQTTRFAALGPVALALTGANTLVAAAVGADGILYAMSRQLVVGASWSTVYPVDYSVKVSPLGGATIVARGHNIMVFAVLPDGRVCRSDFVSGIGWLPLRAT